MIKYNNLAYTFKYAETFDVFEKPRRFAGEKYILGKVNIWGGCMLDKKIGQIKFPCTFKQLEDFADKYGFDFKTAAVDIGNSAVSLMFFNVLEILRKLIFELSKEDHKAFNILYDDSEDLLVLLKYVLDKQYYYPEKLSKDILHNGENFRVFIVNLT